MIKSLDRGLQILGIIAENESTSVTELAELLDVNKSTVSRLIDTLMQHDMIQVEKQTGKYCLGFRILHLSESLKRNLNVIAIAHPVLSQLCKKLNESVHLCAFNNNAVYVVDQVRSDKKYSLSATVGMIEPLHCSSVGKCILAFKSPHKVMEMLEKNEFVKYTPNTITQADKLMDELEVIRSQGYAIDNEELAIGVRCIAVPIYNYQGYVRYSLGISGPCNNMTKELIDKYVKEMTGSANQISRSIGYRSK